VSQYTEVSWDLCKYFHELGLYLILWGKKELSAKINFFLECSIFISYALRLFKHSSSITESTQDERSFSLEAKEILDSIVSLLLLDKGRTLCLGP
jgi:hypothetical protein